MSGKAVKRLRREARESGVLINRRAWRILKARRWAEGADLDVAAACAAARERGFLRDVGRLSDDQLREAVKKVRKKDADAADKFEAALVSLGRLR